LCSASPLGFMTDSIIYQSQNQAERVGQDPYLNGGAGAPDAVQVSTTAQGAPQPISNALRLDLSLFSKRRRAIQIRDRLGHAVYALKQFVGVSISSPGELSIISFQGVSRY
jgi:hypothetical protein